MTDNEINHKKEPLKSSIYTRVYGFRKNSFVEANVNDLRKKKYSQEAVVEELLSVCLHVYCLKVHGTILRCRCYNHVTPHATRESRTLNGLSAASNFRVLCIWFPGISRREAIRESKGKRMKPTYSALA